MQFIQSLDLKTFFFINNLAGHSNSLDFIIVFFANYLAYIIPIIFLIILYRSRHVFIEKIYILAVVSISVIFSRLVVVEGIRLFYHRLRPFLSHDVHQLLTESSYSFPSGHSTVFFTFSFLLYFYNKKWGSWFIVVTIFMTIARVSAGIHYPSDIIGGLFIGFAISYIFFNYLKKPIEKIVNKFFKTNI